MHRAIDPTARTYRSRAEVGSWRDAPSRNRASPDTKPTKACLETAPEATQARPPTTAPGKTLLFTILAYTFRGAFFRASALDDKAQVYDECKVFPFERASEDDLSHCGYRPVA